jgi:hypothetical protein
MVLSRSEYSRENRVGGGAIRAVSFLGLLLVGLAANAAQAEPNAARGQQFFSQACTARHSLEPGKNLTEPSLPAPRLWTKKRGALTASCATRQL